jgi:hypothetical protein
LALPYAAHMLRSINASSTHLDVLLAERLG